MNLRFPPKPGMIVICDYQTGFKAPEMVKQRLALVLSPRLQHRDNLCTVVPLSTTPARSGIKYQCKIELPASAPVPYEGTIKWAKYDMLATLCYARMTLPYTGRDPVTKKRKYLQIVVNEEELRKDRCSVLHALGMQHLTGAL